MRKNFDFREIPYNYTSFSDKEIILRYFNIETWEQLNKLRKQRVTGRSAKLIFEIIGDIFVIDRNPYIFNDFLENKKKQTRLKKLHKIRFESLFEKTDDKHVIDLFNKFKKADHDFFKKFSREKKKRARILHHLSQFMSKERIGFSAYDKVSHVTDATDLRVEYPEVVVYPENVEEITKLVNAAKHLNLKVIPRGGGTGLTGGAIPVLPNTMIINTEKLRKISEMETVSVEGNEIPIVETEAGVITETVTQFCSDKGYIFATDPTSAWASTIGGNISENAGGKKCVMWGTTIDNIYSFQIINSQAQLLEVRRRNHPHRKIEEDDTVIYDIYLLEKKKEKLINTITLTGLDIRKKGIGKDITNKALKGVPGIQKEGGDGVIVSAKFVLYKPFSQKQTICLEFFGTNLINASKAIVKIKETFINKEKKNAYLTALEHFDEKYVQAINYRNKSDRSEYPKAVLLIDVESNSKKFLEEASKKILQIVKPYNTEGFIADTKDKMDAFWKDRKNLGAIAKHTNAFKLNEDIVIPVESLPDFADYIDKLNLENEIKNHCCIIDGITDYFNKCTDYQDDEFFTSKTKSFIASIEAIKGDLLAYNANLDKKAKDVPGIKPRSGNKTLFELLRDGKLSYSIEDNILSKFSKNFHGYDDILNDINEIVAEKKTKQLIIATHMHAGDGNVHVNIPVHSNDYNMMQEADETAGRIMKETTDTFNGVISGEHGIGLTKLKFINEEVLEDYQDYKRTADPDDLFNPGKLTKDFPHSHIYTPSLNLLELEAFILEVSDMKNVINSIASCVRCGKCKEVCNTSHPSNTMFYSPRNKILAVTLITEAVLYDAQTTNNLSFRNFNMLKEVSNHCTMCHNCYTPCPVDIDFGVVSLAIRKLLFERKRSEKKVITNLVLFYLKRRGYYTNKMFRIALLNFAYSMQRFAVIANKPFNNITRKLFPKINGILQSRLPKTGKPSLREYLGLKGSSTFFAFQKPGVKIKKSVVYFPGCGSERMFPEISIAAVTLLYNAGIRVVIPPEFLCCGYPLMANGKIKEAYSKSYENRVIFHRMADICGYMDIKDVVVSCGTCHEMLKNYQLENVFPESKLIDINEFVAREKLYKKKKINDQILYHEPCHTPMKQLGADKTFNLLLGTSPTVIPNCCGEGGTMSLSTPDISNSLRKRKAANIIEATGNNKKSEYKIITTCPSCVQGLSRINGKLSVKGESLAVHLAEIYHGKNWKKKFLQDVVKNDGVERIIL